MTRMASTLPFASAAESNPAGQIASDPAGGSCLSARPAMRQSNGALRRHLKPDEVLSCVSR